ERRSEKTLLYEFHGEMMALKSIDLSKAPSYVLEEMQKEVKIYKDLADIQGKYIPKLVCYGYYGEGMSFVIGMTIVGTPLSEQKIKKQQKTRAIKGLEAIHKYGILYNDIQEENILINDNGVIFLIDFGMAISNKITSSVTQNKKSQSHKKKEAENIVQDVFDFMTTSAPEKNHMTEISMTGNSLPVTKNTDKKNPVVILSDGPFIDSKEDILNDQDNIFKEQPEKAEFINSIKKDYTEFEGYIVKLKHLSSQNPDNLESIEALIRDIKAQNSWPDVDTSVWDILARRIRELLLCPECHEPIFTNPQQKNITILTDRRMIHSVCLECPATKAEEKNDVSQIKASQNTKPSNHDILRPQSSHDNLALPNVKTKLEAPIIEQEVLEQTQDITNLQD
ncbi:11124_t:CDS:2, partial [Funneliformis geosporum]